MAHFIFPGFVYVTPSEPHTGLNSCVDGQSQSATVVVVDVEGVVKGLGLGEVGLSNIKMSSGSSAPGGKTKFGLLLSLFPNCGRLAIEFCGDGCENPSPAAPKGCVCPWGRKLFALMPICGPWIAGLFGWNKSGYQDRFSLNPKSEALDGRDSCLEEAATGELPKTGLLFCAPV
jgi:hypothetical protein